MPVLSFRETFVERPEPVRRDVFLNGSDIATVFVNPRDRVFVLVWKLLGSARLVDVLEEWFQLIADVPGPMHAMTQMHVECLVEGDLRAVTLPLRTDVKHLLNWLPTVKSTVHDKIAFINLANEKEMGGLEIHLTPHETPFQLVCTMGRPVKLHRLVRLFSMFHAERDVRSNFEIAAEAFHPGAKNLLGPASVLDQLTVRP